MALGVKEVIDIAVGALGAVGAVIPDDLKQKLRYTLRDYNPWDKVKTNHDLIRSVRLAWIAAALRVVDAGKTAAKGLPDLRAHDLRAIANQLKAELKSARYAALTRDAAVSAHPIDRVAAIVLGGAPEHVGGGDVATGERAINEGFAPIVAAVIGCPIAEIPGELVGIAKNGLAGSAREPPHSFASLVFKEFAEIIKDGKYPAATEAFRIYLWNQVTREIEALGGGLADAACALGRMEDRLGDWCGRIEGQLSAVRAGTERIEAKVDDIEAQLRVLIERMHPQPGESAALAAEIENLRREADIRDSAIATFLRDAGAVDVRPNRWQAELQRFAQRYRELLAEAERPRNLPTEFERDRLRAAELIRAGDLDGAEALLQRLDSKLERWATEQDEMLRQTQRDRASVNAELGSIAAMRLRHRDAAEAFGKAAEIVAFDPASQRDYRIQQADALFDLGQDFGGPGALEEAMEIRRQVLNTGPHEDRYSWARAQVALGHSLEKLGQRKEAADLLEEAHAAYGAALEVFTREETPLEWAWTHNYIGGALLALAQRDKGTARIEASVAAFRAALAVYTRDEQPQQWAMAQSNLGAALAAWGAREAGTSRFEAAVAAHRAALQVKTREADPQSWSASQINLGIALKDWGEREEGTARLLEAVEAFQAALQVRTLERLPMGWAMINENLGATFRELGLRLEGTRYLDLAVEAYRAALLVYTRENLPLLWASTQDILGYTLCILGERESGTARLEEAVAAHRATLEVYQRDKVPADWAITQHNLAEALAALATREKGTERFEQALSAYRAALSATKRETQPREWAHLQNNLGVLFLNWWRREGAAARLDEAASSFRDALPVFEAAGMPDEVTLVRRNIARANEALARRRSADA
jgi:tetratricopeptide (TPR) repeat protein